MKKTTLLVNSLIFSTGVIIATQIIATPVPFTPIPLIPITPTPLTALACPTLQDTTWSGVLITPVGENKVPVVVNITDVTRLGKSFTYELNGSVTYTLPGSTSITEPLIASPSASKCNGFSGIQSLQIWSSHAELYPETPTSVKWQGVQVVIRDQNQTTIADGNMKQ